MTTTLTFDEWNARKHENDQPADEPGLTHESSSDVGGVTTNETPCGDAPKDVSLMVAEAITHLQKVLGAEVVATVRMVAATAVGDRRAHDDELRQIVVQGPQAIVHPGADGGEHAFQ